MVVCTCAPLSRRAFTLSGGAALSLIAAAGTIRDLTALSFVAWVSSTPASERLLRGLRSSVREFGYLEERSIHIEAHSSTNNAELRSIARKVTEQKVDIIVANGRAAIRAAQEATSEIPIVMAPVDDPYEFVASLARPGGNITGIALQQTEIDAKQIEFLKSIVPSMSKLAIIYYYGETYYALDSVAHTLGIQTIWIEVKSPDDVEHALALTLSKEADGLLIINTDILGDICDRIARGAIAQGLAVAGSWHGDGETQLLVTYAADDRDLQRRVASYVDRLLTGARTEELPIEQVTSFELGISLAAAKSLGVRIPPWVLVRADYVVEESR